MPDATNSPLTSAESLFFEQGGLDRSRAETLIKEGLNGADDGELFLEYCQSESLVFDDGRLKSANFDTNQGFGLRAVADEAQGYAHAADLSESALKRAVATISAVKAGHSGTMAEPPKATNQSLYVADNPLNAIPFEQKTALLAQIDAYTRAKDPRVKQVSCSLAGSWQAVAIMRADGRLMQDIRPLVRLNISVVMEDGERRETGSDGGGGRIGFDAVMEEAYWQTRADEAIRRGAVNLESIDAPAGEMTVVLGSGWPGILFHEAVGHGLEGDLTRKGASVFSTLIGQQVAAPGVTVVDDGTINDRRGSLTIDDEGTPTERTVLIEDGVLKGFMHDRLSARLTGAQPTGNGRRQSYAHQPIPRMTNTYMLNSKEDPGAILESVKSGIYATSFGGGQVETASGKFVFSCTEAYMIENGKLGAPVKGATLIGNGADTLKRISMIGNDMALDTGIGVCGKQGQGVPVGVGQPTLRLDGITVGGTG